MRTPSKWHRLGAQLRSFPLLTLLLGLGLGAKYDACREVQPSCQAASRADHELTVLICQEEYAQGHEPRTGAILADELRRSKNYPEAKKVANELLDTSARADALSVRGKIARAENELDRAERDLTEAADLHAGRSEWRAAATDLLALARVLDEQQRYPQAIEVRDHGAHFSRLAKDASLEADFHLSAARAFIDIGNHAGAEAELNRAKIPGQAPRLDVLLAEANFRQEIRGHRQAVNLYAELQGSGRLSRAQELTVSAELAYSFVELRELDLASEHLAIAKALDTKGTLKSSLASIEGLLEWRRGKDLTRADSLMGEAIDELGDSELNDKADFSIDRAEIALERDDLEGARKHAQQAVSCIEAIREKLRTRYRSSITERYRRGYELLFLALARAGDTQQALAVLEGWQGQDTLNGLLPIAAPRACEDLKCAADDALALTRVNEALRASSLFRNAPAGELNNLVRGSDLVAIVLIQLGPRDTPSKRRDELWRLTAREGKVQLKKLGLYADLANRFQQFTATPLDDRDASAMGALLIPTDMAVRTDRVLHVLLDSKLGALPIPALRFGGAPLIALRPVLRVLRPSDVSCAEPLPANPRVVVLGDAAADLPGAASESEAVASRFGVASLTREKATLAALRAPADLLHVAVHGDIDAESGDGILRMHDGDEHAIEIAARGQAPALVVLAACLSAVSESNYSLATAYLAAGAHQVVATTRPISDGGTMSVAKLLYEQGGLKDPVRALAKVQAQLASTTTDQTWPLFAIYGRPTCKVGQVANK